MKNISDNKDFIYIKRHFSAMAENVSFETYNTSKFIKMITPIDTSKYHCDMGDIDFVKSFFPIYLDYAVTLEKFRKHNGIAGIVAASYLQDHPISMRVEYYSDVNYFHEIFNRLKLKCINVENIRDFKIINQFDFSQGTIDIGEGEDEEVFKKIWMYHTPYS